MKNIKYIFLFLFALAACSNPQPENKAIPQHAEASAGITIDTTLLATMNDTTCGMSLREGIADTLTANGKIYGFCSTGCKESFAELISKAPAHE